MKEKRKKTKSRQQRAWETAAKSFEDPKESLEILKSSRVLSASEKRKLLGPSKTEAISIRLPQEDLAILKDIATSHQRPYQQLIATAVELYIDQATRLLKSGRSQKDT